MQLSLASPKQRDQSPDQEIHLQSSTISARRRKSPDPIESSTSEKKRDRLKYFNTTKTLHPTIITQFFLLEYPMELFNIQRDSLSRMLPSLNTPALKNIQDSKYYPKTKKDIPLPKMLEVYQFLKIWFPLQEPMNR